MNDGRLLLGLTGLYCAGKNFVGKIFEENGFAVLDLDKLGHIALENRRNIIVKRFGNDFLKPDGTVDRRALGAYVFSKPDKLAALGEIVHPEVNSLTLEWMKVHQDVHCVINAALLHKSCVFAMLDSVIFVRAPYIIRMIRAKRRDRLSWREIRQRFSSQQFDIYCSVKNFDIYYIDNWGFGFFARLNRGNLVKKINRLVRQLEP